MKDGFQEILDSLPTVKSRSRLEPYKDLICEMRRRNHSYRAISRVLAEKGGLRISHSTVHEFVHRYAVDGPPRVAACESVDQEHTFEVTKPMARDTSVAKPPRTKQMEEHLAAIKQQVPILQDHRAGFQFDASEPLRLKPGKK